MRKGQEKDILYTYNDIVYAIYKNARMAQISTELGNFNLYAHINKREYSDFTKYVYDIFEMFAVEITGLKLRNSPKQGTCIIF